MSAEPAEVTGLTQAIAYAQHLADHAGAHGPHGNEGYLARLAACQVAGAGLATAHTMQHAFAAAAAAATAHAAELGKQTTVQEAYDQAPDAGDKTFLTGETTGSTAASGPDTDDSRKDTMTTSAGPAAGPADAGRGGELPDTAGITAAEHWHASDVITARDGKVCLGLCQYPDSGAYIVVATRPSGQPWQPDSTANGIDPPLSPHEAEQLADTLDELAALARSGTVAAPTKAAQIAERVRGLLGDNGAVTIVGDDGEIEVSAADIRTLLDAAAPEPAVPTRRKVTSKACQTEGFDTGTVWAQLDTTSGEPVIAVTSTEANEQPEDYPAGYTTTRLTPAEAGQLADKVRRFARNTPTADAAQRPHAAAAERAQAVAEHLRDLTQRVQQRADHGISDEQISALFDGLSVAELKQVAEATGMPATYLQRTRQDLIRYVRGNTVDNALTFRAVAGDQAADTLYGRQAAPTPAPAAPNPAAPTPARRVTSTRGRTYEYDPGSGATAVIEPDGWRAVVPPGSATGLAARLLYWRAEITDGRGDDATVQAGRNLLAGLSAAELRELADTVGTPLTNARTKPQMVDAIINLTIGAPLKYRGLRKR